MAFEEILIPAITGYKLEEIEESNRPALLAYCVKFFLDFIFAFVEEVYGKKELIRLKSGLIFQDSKLYLKFPELNKIFDEAYTSFFKAI